MTYNEAKVALANLQSARDSAQAALDMATASLADAQSAVNLSQSAVDAFHRYTVMTVTANTDIISDVELPEDAEISGAQATVYRDTPPDPVPCKIQTYESGGGVWSDPSSFSLSWTDNGPANQ